MDGISSSDAKRLCPSSVPIIRRIGLCGAAQVAGSRVHKSGLLEVRCALLETIRLFWAGPPKATQPPWLSEVKNSAFLVSSILMFWGLGRALRLRKPGARLFFWLILLCPAVYYIVFPAPRYRHPIEPEMTILCVFLITEAIKGEEKAPSVRNLR